VDWIYRSTSVTARINKVLKVYAGPDDTQAEFMKACAEAARKGADREIEKSAAQYDRKIKALQDKIAREERELEEDEAELSHRKIEEMGTHAENVLGIFGGGRRTRRLSTSLTKRRMTEQAKAEVEESLDALSDYERRLKGLRLEREQAIEAIEERWGALVNDESEITITPRKTNIFTDLFGLAWNPFYLVQSEGKLIELPAYGHE
jgi:hypothetical protein